METKTTNIWIWLQNDEIYKSISCPVEGTISIYDEHEQLILKRTGLTKLQVKQIEDNIIRYGVKKLSAKAEPFRFLGK